MCIRDSPLPLLLADFARQLQDRAPGPGGDVAGAGGAVLKLAGEIGKEEGERVAAAATARAEQIGKGRDADRIRKAGGDAAKRADRRSRTDSIDLALALTAFWFVDLIAVAEGAPGLVRNLDRSAALTEGASDLDPALARRAAELAMETRRRLQVNVSEELALEALFHRIAASFA